MIKGQRMNPILSTITTYFFSFPQVIDAQNKYLRLILAGSDKSLNIYDTNKHQPCCNKLIVCSDTWKD